MSHDPMAEIRASFFVECEELLESLQDALALMDEGEHDKETINVVFRAVHSIKGGAGAFGLSALVAFAHRFETVMDEVRSDKLAIEPENVKLFFAAADFLQDHVRAAREGAGEPEGAEDVLLALEALIGPRAAPEQEPDYTDFTPMGLSFDLGLPGLDPAPRGPQGFELRFTPAPNLYGSGNEAFLLLQAVARLGKCETSPDLSRLPPLEALEPETSYLGWTLRLETEQDEADLREVFDFVEDLCDLTITPLTAPEHDSADLPTAQRECESLPALAAVTAPQGPDPSAETAAAPIATSPKAKPEAAKSGGNEAAATVRVDLDRIDRLVNLVGELVINQAMLAQSVAEAGLPSNSAVMTGLEAFMMLTRDIQDSVMAIRAQPVKPLFQRMGRIVREASSAIGKEVRLRTEGENTEVDKTVIERLADPLTHMIRNSVDHGIEKPEDRRAAGKPPEGTIVLSAQHRSGRVIIEIEDDGAGINRPRVKEVAISKGLIAPDAQLTDTEIDNLLFLPGFSTASQISALSGRGVGMDVVRSAIQSLGGRISISSERGKGTKFSISLPLTLAVLDGMVVQVAGETLVVPLAAIVETAALAKDDIRALGPNTNVLHVRGGFVPLYDLGFELGYREPKSTYVGGIVLLTAQEDGSRAALVVDAIMEQRQVVIKALTQGYGRIPGIAAATILGDGQIALIVDPADLVINATGRTRSPYGSSESLDLSPEDYALAG